jgi:hypothetical protein
MAGMPAWLLRHSVMVEAWAGEGPDGPRYAAAVAAACFLDEQTRMVRQADGTQVSSTSTAYAPLTVSAPAGSRVTLPDGRRTTVIAALRRDGGGLATPDHLEIQLV